MAGKKKAAANKLRIQYYRSAIGFNKNQKLIVKGLGLRKLNAVREAEDTEAIRGMVAKVPHLLRIHRVERDPLRHVLGRPIDRPGAIHQAVARAEPQGRPQGPGGGAAPPGAGPPGPRPAAGGRPLRNHRGLGPGVGVHNSRTTARYLGIFLISQTCGFPRGVSKRKPNNRNGSLSNYPQRKIRND